jgi:hypothetical protein
MAKFDEATLKTACERFCKAGQADAESRAKQNNTMISMCLNKLLMASAKASLLTYRNEYTFDSVEYAPLMYKIIMRLATIDSIATTQTLRDNLQNLGVFAVTVKGDIDKVNAEFDIDMNYSQLLIRGATLNDPIGILFEAYLLVPCYNFTKYISTKHDDGASTTWLGPYTSLLIASLGSSARTSRRSPRPTLPPSLLRPPRQSTPNSPPSWPPWPAWTRTNDGSRRHAYITCKSHAWLDHWTQGKKLQLTFYSTLFHS